VVLKGEDFAMKKRFSEEQIAFALRQAETGIPVAEVIRKMGISEQTFYRWKRIYEGHLVIQERYDYNCLASAGSGSIEVKS
jgi:transposase-like protein